MAVGRRLAYWAAAPAAPAASALPAERDGVNKTLLRTQQAKKSSSMYRPARSSCREKVRNGGGRFFKYRV